MKLGLLGKSERDSQEFQGGKGGPKRHKTALALWKIVNDNSENSL